METKLLQKNIKAIFATIILLTCFKINLYAQDLPVKAGKILDLCYEMKLKSADSLWNSYYLEMKAGEEVEFYMLKATIYWWKIITGISDKNTKVTYYKTLAIAENYFEKEKDKGYSHFYKGISLYGYMARMDGLNKNYLKAFFRINSCLKFLEKSFGAESKYPFFYLSSGLYNYHMVVTARQYPVLSPYLNLYPKGDQKKGIEFLHLAADHQNKYLSIEGHYFLMKLYFEEKKYQLALAHVDELVKRFPENGIFLFYKFSIQLNSGNQAEAQKTCAQLFYELKRNKQLSAAQLHHFEKVVDEVYKKFKSQKLSP